MVGFPILEIICKIHKTIFILTVDNICYIKITVTVIFRHFYFLIWIKISQYKINCSLNIHDYLHNKTELYVFIYCICHHAVNKPVYLVTIVTTYPYLFEDHISYDTLIVPLLPSLGCGQTAIGTQLPVGTGNTMSRGCCWAHSGVLKTNIWRYNGCGEQNQYSWTSYDYQSYTELTDGILLVFKQNKIFRIGWFHRSGVT